MKAPHVSKNALQAEGPEYSPHADGADDRIAGDSNEAAPPPTGAADPAPAIVNGNADTVGDKKNPRPEKIDVPAARAKRTPRRPIVKKNLSRTSDVPLDGGQQKFFENQTGRTVGNGPRAPHRSVSGKRNLDEQIVMVDELIQSKRFDSVVSVYNTPDSTLPRIRRNGKIMRPLRFYRSDVERLFSSPGEVIDLATARPLNIESRQTAKTARPSILFKKRRK